MKNSIAKRMGLTVVMVGVVLGGVAAAQTLRTPTTTRFLNSGMFTLEAGWTADFHVSLDDNEGGAGSQAVLKLYDAAGDEELSSGPQPLAPGASITLHVGPSGDTSAAPRRFRAHARVVEPDVKHSKRRTFTCSVEIHPTNGGTIGGLTTTIPVSCQDNAGSGKIPN